LHRLKPSVLAAVEASHSVPHDETGGFSPWLDLAGMMHEHQFFQVVPLVTAVRIGIGGPVGRARRPWSTCCAAGSRSG